MKTLQEIEAEIGRIYALQDLDEAGLVVRMVTLIALEWVQGYCPVAPSERMQEVNGEVLEGILSNGGDENGQ